MENWPKVEKKFIRQKIRGKNEKVKEIVALALAERAKAGIKVRQPLTSLKIRNPKSEIRNENELLDLIKEEVNVKEIIFDEKIEKEIELDTKITDELKEEGIIREVIRNIQGIRKETGLKPENRILIYYVTESSLSGVLEKNRTFITKETLTENLRTLPIGGADFDVEKEIYIDGRKLWLGIKKV